VIAEIAVVPQIERPAREVVAHAVEEIEAQGLRYQVGATCTTVEGALEDVFAAVRAIRERLGDDGVERAVIELRLQLEPHEETLEHQVEGLGRAQEQDAALGLSEQELREKLEEELVRAMRAEGNAPTVHAIAHSIARILELDHLRIAEQLEGTGVRVA
jgi:uncharacterized protein YqgV (UPF0045/DUF77 family)